MIVIRQFAETAEGPEGSAIEAAVTVEPAINSTQLKEAMSSELCHTHNLLISVIAA